MMNAPPDDLSYAYSQLGLDRGAPFAEIEKVLVNARSYKFSTQARIDQVQRLVAYFSAREKLGGFTESFVDLRKAYHKMAMALHPDRHHGNAQSEDELKAINEAYSRVEEMQHEARDYFRFNEQYRRETESEARERTARERPPRQAGAESNRSTSSPPAGGAHHGTGKKFMAASVPRNIRSTRLSHIPINRVIGCWFIDAKNDINQVFDVIMLPEVEFYRMKLHLSVPNMNNPALQPGSFSPPYILKDIKEVIVSDSEANPSQFAKDYFVQLFKLTQTQKS